MTKRESGHYWVKHIINVWLPAEWSKEDECWLMIGHTVLFKDKHLAEIGPRIQPPEENEDE